MTTSFIVTAVTAFADNPLVSPAGAFPKLAEMIAPTILSQKGNLKGSAISFRPSVLLGTTRSLFGYPTNSLAISRQLPLHP